jgi:hypothetical protein
MHVCKAANPSNLHTACHACLQRSPHTTVVTASSTTFPLCCVLVVATVFVLRPRGRHSVSVASSRTPQCFWHPAVCQEDDLLLQCRYIVLATRALELRARISSREERRLPQATSTSQYIRPLSKFRPSSLHTDTLPSSSATWLWSFVKKGDYPRPRQPPSTSGRCPSSAQAAFIKILLFFSYMALELLQQLTTPPMMVFFSFRRAQLVLSVQQWPPIPSPRPTFPHPSPTLFLPWFSNPYLPPDKEATRSFAGRLQHCHRNCPGALLRLTACQWQCCLSQATRQSNNIIDSS